MQFYLIIFLKLFIIIIFYFIVLYIFFVKDYVQNINVLEIIIFFNVIVAPKGALLFG